MSQEQRQPLVENAIWRQRLDQLNELFSQAIKISSQEDTQLLQAILDQINALFPQVVQQPKSVSPDDQKRIIEVLNLHNSLIDQISRKKQLVAATVTKINQGKQLLAAYTRNSFKK